jgi:hypothetical protein
MRYVGMRGDVGTSTWCQLVGAHEVGEDERPDHAPGVERQQAVDLGPADAPATRGDDPLDAHPASLAHCAPRLLARPPRR